MAQLYFLYFCPTANAVIGLFLCAVSEFRARGCTAALLKGQNRAETEYFVGLNSAIGKHYIRLCADAHSSSTFDVCGCVRMSFVAVGEAKEEGYSTDVQQNFDIVLFLTPSLRPAAHLCDS